MKISIAVLCIACLAGCASTGISTPAEYALTSDQLDSLFADNYREIERLHNTFADRARELAGEGRILNGLSATAATASLAFAGFDAHPDNIVASTLVGGVSLATSNQLSPLERARLRVRGTLALRCIAEKADTLRYSTRRNNARLGAALLSGASQNMLAQTTIDDAMAMTQALAGDASGRFLADGMVTSDAMMTSYDILDALLYLVMAMAQSVETPSDGLQAALDTAQQNRTKLALGIQAHNKAFETMSDAIETVRSAVYDEAPPSISSLVDAIAQVELPDAASRPAASGDSPEAVQQKLLGPLFDNLEGNAEAAAAARNAEVDRILTVTLGFLSTQVERLAPELDDATVRGMTACVAELASN